MKKAPATEHSKLHPNSQAKSAFDQAVKDIEDSVPTTNSNSSKNSVNTPHYLAQKTRSLEMTNRLFFVNSLVRQQQKKATMDEKNYAKHNPAEQMLMKKLTLEDFEKFEKKTLQKHFHTKRKHKGFKKNLKLILRKD